MPHVQIDGLCYVLTIRIIGRVEETTDTLGPNEFRCRDAIWAVYDGLEEKGRVHFA